MRTIHLVVLCCSLVACHRTFGIPRDMVRDLPSLASVRTIYIDDLTHGENPHLVEGSDLVKEKIRQTLTQSGRFVVVERPEHADALLTGVAGFQRWYFGMESFFGLEGSLNTQYAGIGMIRLLDAKTKRPIWTHEYETGVFHPTQPVVDRVSKQIAEKLLSDASLAAQLSVPDHPVTESEPPRPIQ
ncbi:MAG: hypothetical protein NNA20_08765 [Nitrospira sp.]|nr:hypothetical protein [Nitrospira sp.]MCP9442673.1 hypothetical protein [Nitrospira sp.]